MTLRWRWLWRMLTRCCARGAAASSGRAFEPLEPRLCLSSWDVALIDATLDRPDLIARAANAGTRVILYDGATESPEQVLRRVIDLAETSGWRIGSVSIFSHGAAGAFSLGNERIAASNIDETANVWRDLGRRMAIGGDIYIYGCSVASEFAGEKLITTLAELTGADVFGSTNITGQGGDWLLETASRGAVLGRQDQLQAAFSQTALAQYTGSLGTLTVRDDFSSDSYSLNTGSANWSTSWTEVGETTDPTQGSIKTNGGFLRVLTTASAKSIWREANLAGATSATLSVSYRRTGTAGGTVLLEMSSNGGSSWSTVRTYTLTAADGSFTTETFNVSSYVASNTRFRINATTAIGNNTWIDFHHVEISCVHPAVPTVTTTGSALAYTEGAAATAIDGGLTVTDDSANLTGATIQITGNYDSGKDVLAFTNQNGITGTWSSATGTMTLSGTASVANYQTALRSVTFVNTSTAPSTAARTVSFRATDGTYTSSAAARTISVTAVGPGIFTDNQDVGSPSIFGEATYSAGTYTVTGSGYDIWDMSDQFHFAYSSISGNAEVVARVTSQTNPDGNAKAGVMFRDSTAANAAYAMLFRNPDGALRFEYRSSNGATAANNVYIVNPGSPIWLRLVRNGSTFAAYYSTDGTSWTQAGSNQTVTMGATALAGLAVTSRLTTASCTATFDYVSFRPILSGIEGTSLAYTEGGAATAITSTLTVSDPDSTSLTGATIQITGNYDSGKDVLAFANTASITGTWTSATGTMTLSGTASVAEYQAALRSVTYRNTSNFPSTAARTVSFAVTDGAGTSPAVTRGITVTPIPSLGIFTSTQDIGSPALAGSADYDPNTNTYYVDGAGSDIWGTSDQFRYLYSSMSGDATIIARVTSVENTGANEKAAVMFRDSTAANAAYAILFVNSDYSVRFEYRASNGASAAQKATTGNLGGPMWLKLVRSGSSFTAHYSSDGSSWTQLGTSQTVTMAATALVGLAVSSQNTAAVNTSTFDNVALHDAVNDPPVNNVPGAQSTNEGTPLVFSGSTAITDIDVEIGGNAMELTLSVVSGTLTLASLAGLSFTTGDGTSDATMTFTGTIAAINTALNGLTYTGNVGFTGTDTLTVTSNDQGNTGSGGAKTDTDTVSITVNDINVPPVNTVPGAQTVNQGSLLTFSSGNGNLISIADDDAGANSVEVTLTATNGTLTLSQLVGLSFTTGDGTSDGTMVFTGTIANINAALAGMTFAHAAGYVGSASVQISTDDQGFSGGPAETDTDTVAVTVVIPAPSGLTGTPISSSRIDLSWTDNSSFEDGFRVERSANGTSGWTEIGTTAAGVSTYSDTGLSSGTVYYYRVRASQGSNYSSYTSVYAIPTMGTPTVAPAASDAFGYTGGSSLSGQSGGTGWSGAWSGSGTISSTGLSYTNTNTLSTSGGLASVGGSGIQNAARSFSSTLGTAGTTKWIGFLIRRNTHVSSGDGFFALVNSGGARQEYGWDGNSNWQISESYGNEVSASSAPVTGTTYFIVLRIDFAAGNDTVRMYINPTPGFDEPTTAAITKSSFDLGTVTGVELRTNKINVDFDEIRVGDSYSAVAPISGGISGPTGLTATANSSSQITLNWTDNQTGESGYRIERSTDNVTFTDIGMAAANATSYVDTGLSGSTTYYYRVRAYDASYSTNYSSTASATTLTAPPVLAAIEGTSLPFTENGAATPITATLTVSDSDSTNLTGATIQITGNYSTGDVLAFTDQNGITGSWNGATGTLTLSGTSSLANYQAALRSITYQNTSDNPSTAARTISFTVSDGGSSNTVTRDVAVTAVNDAPVLSAIEGTTLPFTENGAAIAITSSILISDADSTNLTGATIQITGNYSTGDVLAFTNTASITGSWNAATGTLTLSGTATVAQYQAALRSVTYQNTSDNPSTATRTISFSATDGSDTSNAQTRDVSVAAVNDAPSVSTSGGSTSYTENGAGVAIDGSLTLADADSTDLTGATITISSGLVSGDTLVFTDQNGITGSYNSSTGVLTLSGTATIANYQAALRSITFSSTSDDPGSGNRTISFVVSDGALSSSAATKTVAVTPINDAPTVGTNAGLTVAEGASGTITSARLALTDPDSAAADLEYTVTAVPGNGTLYKNGVALANNDTFTQDDIANNLITYTHNGGETSGDSFTFTVSDGAGGSIGATTFNITVTAVNDAPVLSAIEGSSLNFTEDDAATAITTSLLLGDVDDTSIEGATVQITGNYQSGEDVLAFTDQNGITGSWNGATGTLTLSGSATVAQYQAALRSITYQNTSDDPDTGARTVSFTVTDGSASSNTVSRSISITAVNDAPVVTVPSAQTVNEDADLVFSSGNGNAITIADADVNPGTIEITVEAVNGQLTLGNLTGLTFLSGDGTSDALMTFQGTLANVNAALAGLRFRGTSNFNGAASVTVTADDGSASDSQTVTVTVDPVNDDPTVASPIPDRTATEDVAFNYQFPAGTFDDVDAGDTLTYSATLADGSALPAWLSFDAAQRRFTGTPANGDVGTYSVKVTADDGNGGTISDTFTLTVNNTNDAPTVANPIADQGATEDSAFSFQFSANTFDDVDAGDTLTYSATLSDGSALPSWLTFNAATRTFSGTPANGDVGVFTVRVTADDGNGGTVTDDFTITVTNTNDAPTVANPIADQSATEDQAFSYQFPSNTFDDVDAGDTLTYSATLSDGSALPAWLSFNAATRTFSGTPANSDVGVYTVRVTADDGNGGTVSDTFTVTVNPVNDAPVNSVPGAQTMDEDTTLVFSSGNGNQISISDADAAAGDLEVTLTAANGTITLSQITGLTFSAGDGAGDAVMTFTGSLAAINAALNGLSFTPTQHYFGAAASITITTDDQGNTGAGGAQSDTDTINITVDPVNDLPTVTAGGTLNYTEGDGAQTIDGGITVADVDDANLTGATVTISGNYASGQDVLSVDTTGTNITASWNAVTGVLTLSGSDTVANYQLVLRRVAYENTSLAPTTGNRTISVAVSEDDGTSASATATVSVADVNDPPVHTVPGAQAMDEEDVLVFSAGNGNPISISDADLGANELEVTLSVTTGTLTLGQLTGLTITSGANGSGAMTFTGTLADVNAALNGLSYAPPANFFGSATITIATSDQGATGGGGAQSDSDTIAVTVNNTQDAPTVANPIADQSATEDSPFSFQFVANTFDDVDLDTLTYSATLSDGSALPAWLSFNAATRTFSGTPVNADVGVYTVRVTADDGNGGTISDTFTITVNNTNDAPTVANPVADQSATEDVPFSFQFAANTFDDVDAGDTLTYSATLSDGSALPAWLSFNAATRTFSGTPANGDVGAFTIRLTADDGNGGTVSDTFTVTVNNTNDAPTVANPIGDQSATEDAPFSFQFPSNAFADVDAGDTLTYSATLSDGSALPAWLAFNAATRTFSGTPANADVGVYTVRVTADDGNGGTVTDDFTITVNNTNDAPTVANPLVDQNATEDAPFSYQFAGNTFDDVDAGDTLTYSATLSDGSALPAWLSFNAATRTFSGTPANGDVGTYTVRVTADDGNGGTVSDSFSVTVANTNDAPSVANPIADQSATEDSPFSFQFPSNTFADVDAGDTLTYSATLSDGSALPTWLSFNAATRTFSGTPANADVGVYTVRVTADDGNGGAVADTFTVTVNNTNDAPTVAVPVPDQNATEDAPFSYQFPAGTFDDVDGGDTLTYSATLSDGSALPSWLTFNAGTRTFSGTPLNQHVGTITVRLTASDGNGGTVSDDFAITVANTNDAPTVANPVADQNGTQGNLFYFQIPSDTIVDVDAGDTLTFTATLGDGSALPAWLSFDAATRTLSGTPSNADVGTYTIRVTADDGNGGSVSDTFDVVIDNVNDAPGVVTSGGSLSYSEDDGPVAIDDALTLSDPDDAFLEGAIVTISGNYVPGEDVLEFTDQNGITGVWNAATGTLTLSGSALLSDYQAALRSITYRNASQAPSTATRTVSFTVNDGDLNSSAGTRDIAVTPVNDAPTVVTPAGAAPGVVTGTTTDLSVLGDDADDGEAGLTYTWSVTGKPAGASDSTFSVNGTNAAKATTATFSRAGTYQFTVTISDGSLSTMSTVTVTVDQTLTGVSVSPSAPPALTHGATRSFTATALDQFGQAMVVQPAIAWSLDGGSIGTINGTGVYQAPSSGAGTATVRATAGAYSGTAIVTVVNLGTVGVADAYAVNEDGVLTVSGSGVVGNDVNPDNDVLTVDVLTQPAHGVLVMNPNGSFTYTPDANYFGTDTFTYRAHDGVSDTGAVTVTITINPVNDAPVAQADSFVVQNGMTLTGNVLTNDIDVDGDALATTLLSQTVNGTVQLQGDGSFVYYAAQRGFSGIDTFTYRTTDGSLTSAVTTVTITVTPGTETPPPPPAPPPVDEPVFEPEAPSEPPPGPQEPGDDGSGGDPVSNPPTKAPTPTSPTPPGTTPSQPTDQKTDDASKPTTPTTSQPRPVRLAPATASREDGEGEDNGTPVQPNDLDRLAGPLVGFGMQIGGWVGSRVAQSLSTDLDGSIDGMRVGVTRLSAESLLSREYNRLTYANSPLSRRLDDMKEQIRLSAEQIPQLTVGSAAVLSALGSFGYVIWCIRSGSFLASLLSSIPLWGWFDPLPVLDNNGTGPATERGKKGAKSTDEDEMRLEKLIHDRETSD